MSDAIHSTAPLDASKTPRRIKPTKPYPDFPLYAHAAGYWAKCIRNHVHYFGPWEDPQGALDKYLAQKDDLHAGRSTREEQDAITVKGLFNAFLASKEAKIATGELSQRTWNGYREVLTLALKMLGKRRLVVDLRPVDFGKLRAKLAERWGLHRLSTAIQTIRSAFKYGYAADLIDRVIKTGPDFQKPSQKSMRLLRAKQGPKLFTREEIHKLLNAAGPQMRAMILLGINAGFGNHDCGSLPLSALDPDAAIIDFPRPKTGLPRRCPLWSETVTALREYLDRRPEPKDAAHAGRVFITKYGQSWYKDDSTTNPVSQEMGKLLRSLHINGRKGLGFYTLRHVFRTVADEAKDRPATDHIMGHTPPANDMGSVYREAISDARLRAVSDYVRTWLFGAPGKTPEGE